MLKKKKEAKKRWAETQLEEDRVIYRERNKEAKKAVAQAKAKAYENLYTELETKEGQNKIFNPVNARNKSTKDITLLK